MITMIEVEADSGKHQELERLQAQIAQCEHPFIVIQLPMLQTLKESHGSKFESALQEALTGLVESVIGRHCAIWDNRRMCIQVLDADAANNIHPRVEKLSRDLEKGLKLQLTGADLQITWVERPLIGVVEHCQGLTAPQRLTNGCKALKALEGMAHQLRAPMNIAYFQAESEQQPTLWRKQKAVRLALQNQELELQFSPIFDSVTDALAGFHTKLKPIVTHDQTEIRLNHDDIVSISDTLKADVECSLTIFKLALHQCRVWQLLIPGNDMSITVQLDADSLMCGSQHFQDLASHYDDVSDQILIALHVREDSTAADHLPDLNSVIEKMHKKTGVRFAITEFGMGSLHFQMAQELSVQRIYLANQWPDNAAANSFENPILPELINLLHTFRIEVVATNVNSEAQLQNLKHAHVDQYERSIRKQPYMDESTTIQMIENHQLTIAQTVINAQYRFRKTH